MSVSARDRDERRPRALKTPREEKGQGAPTAGQGHPRVAAAKFCEVEVFLLPFPERALLDDQVPFCHRFCHSSIPLGSLTSIKADRVTPDDQGGWGANTTGSPTTGSPPSPPPR